MTCTTMSRANKCGKCRTSINDDKLMTLLSSLCLVRIGAILMWSNKVTDDKYASKPIISVVIHCNTQTEIFTRKHTDKIYHEEMKKIYILFLSKWCTHNSTNKHKQVIETIMVHLQEVNDIHSLNKLRIHVIRIVKKIESIYESSGKRISIRIDNYMSLPTTDT